MVIAALGMDEGEVTEVLGVTGERLSRAPKSLDRGVAVDLRAAGRLKQVGEPRRAGDVDLVAEGELGDGGFQQAVAVAARVAVKTDVLAGAALPFLEGVPELGGREGEVVGVVGQTQLGESGAEIVAADFVIN